ncbi:hypothetical protein FOZ62_004875 [Perkinsus olseni]|uniref:Uncharacterized protein n=1 Tax=Perkinsus olseni TaxID=32597 RepID=A0A7J6QH43_PEROL|nr:hypothetical protein FOZ62_004875 [Perkinsus olseni]
MSPEQLIVSTSTAAAALCNFPQVAAIGAIAPDLLTYGYPAWSKASYFDTEVNVTFCRYDNIAADPRAELTMQVRDSIVYASSIECPETNNRSAFYITYDYFTRKMVRYVKWSQGGNFSEFRFDEHTLPNNTALDPLRVIDISSIRRLKDRLDIAASEIKFQPDDYGDSIPDDSPYDEEDGDFLDDNGDEVRGLPEEDDDEESVPMKHCFSAWERYNINTASTELPIEELEEVCSATMKLLIQHFGDFDHLCGVFHAASETAVRATSGTRLQSKENETQG